MILGDLSLYLIGTPHGSGYRSGSLPLATICPLPEAPKNAPLPAIRTLLGLPLFAPELSPITLGSYGICAVFESERVTIGKGYGQFRPGIRVH